MKTHKRLANRARARTNRAVKAGLLPPVSSQRCVDCGAPAAAYDHRDLDQPLDVVPVCVTCNNRRGPAIGGTSASGFVLTSPSHVAPSVFAERLGVTARRVRILCEEARIYGAFKQPNGQWLIPAGAVVSPPMQPGNRKPHPAPELAEIRRRIDAGETQRSIAKSMGLGESAISQLKRRGRI